MFDESNDESHCGLELKWFKMNIMFYVENVILIIWIYRYTLWNIPLYTMMNFGLVRYIKNVEAINSIMQRSDKKRLIGKNGIINICQQNIIFSRK